MNLEKLSCTRFSPDGHKLDQQIAATDQLDSKFIGELREQFSRLSGDLDLPLEVPLRLPEPQAELLGIDEIRFQVNSNAEGAFVLYLADDECIFCSLYLAGGTTDSENEFADVFRYFLLDEDETEDASDDNIDRILASKLFDFGSVKERPAVCWVDLSHSDEATPELKSFVEDYLVEQDLCIATAFLTRKTLGA